MATQYGRSTAQGPKLIGKSVDPADLRSQADAITGITSVQQGLSGVGAAAGNPHGATSGSTVISPNLGMQGALNVVDDALYVDGDDGLLGADGRWFPGNYQAQVYRNEKNQAIGHGSENPNLNVQSLEPVGVSADMALLDGT